MELFQPRLEQLVYIWTDLGLLKNSTRERPEWVKLKLKPALDALDQLIMKESFQRELLIANLDDTKVSVEEKCKLLGRNVDLYIGHNFSTYHTLYPSYLRLCELDEMLGEEINQNKTSLRNYQEQLKTLTMELRTPEKLPSLMLNDFSNATVIFVRTLVEELSHIKSERLRAFNNTVGNLYEAWETLEFTATDPLEEELITLFEKTRSNLKMEILEEHSWYSPTLQDPLNLTLDCIELLKSKQLQYCVDFNERKQHRERISSYITRLYDDLEVPVSEQKTFRRGFDEKVISEMVLELNQLRQSLLASLDSIIEEYKSKLTNLWEKCQVDQDERDRTIERILEGVDKVERGKILQVEMERLDQIYNKCLKIFQTMKERKELIQKMIDFEKTASDPKRLFRSSFQLNEEERWRKTAYPNLLKFEEQLIDAIMIYENEENTPFMHNGVPYLETLHNEIADRPVNLSVFGFVNGQSTKPRSGVNSASSSLNNSPASSPMIGRERDRCSSPLTRGSSRPPSSLRSMSPSNALKMTGTRRTNTNGRVTPSNRHSMYSSNHRRESIDSTASSESNSRRQSIQANTMPRFKSPTPKQLPSPSISSNQSTLNKGQKSVFKRLSITNIFGDKNSTISSPARRLSVASNSSEC